MKVAVLGAAHGHVKYAYDEVSRRPECELVAVSEPNAELRRKFAGDWSHLPTYDTADALLDNHQVDVAVVAGVYSQRAMDAVSALNAGCHVIADKPLLTSLDDLAAVEAAAGRAQRQVSIIFSKRSSASTLALRDLLDAGVLGEIALMHTTGPHKMLQSNRPEWFMDPNRYGDIAADLPIHDIDMVLALSRATSGTVSCLTGNARADDHPHFQDHVAILMRADDVTATLDAHWLHPEGSQVHGRYRMRVIGTEGTAEVDWADDTLTVSTHDRSEWDEPLPAARRPAQELFDAFLEGAVPPVGTTESLRASRVALLARQSARNGGTTLDW